MNRALLYVRVSSADQVKGLSLDVQEKACRLWCERESVEIAAIYREEGESAKTTDRPELQRMLGDAAKKNAGVGFVVVYDLSRLTRDTLDYLTIRAELNAAGVKLRAATQNLDETDEGEFVETILSAANKLDNKIRRRKVLAGMREAVARGRWVWQAPIGYRFSGKALEPDPATAPLLRWAFEEAARGLRSKDEIRAELESRGLSIPRETLYRALRNPVYAGRIVVRKWGVDEPGAFPALVGLATFRAATKYLRERRSYVTGATESFPFRQVTRCSCGRGLAGYRATGKAGKRFPYYRCQPCRMNVPAGRVEAMFADLLDGMATPPPILDAFALVLRDVLANRDRRQAERAEAANRRLAVERARLAKLSDAFVFREAVSEPEYRTMRAKIESTIQALEEEASIALSPAVSFEHAWATGRQLLEAPLLTWDRLSPDGRIQFLRGVFPDGLTMEPPGQFRTPTKSLMYLPLQADSEGIVESGTPDEANLEHFPAWVTSLSVVAGLAVH